ncbi:PAAR domain-containing protein [Paraburkholderia sp. BCC1884]|uniref:PAAR domain-containing protein n=1 Tax=Paraburkholderia sp. BCC1884 TaxID=2562668 RepID=UPI00164309AD|nr:PAAR domain-containing protein [Paraburkholderia sp. BCC1884]
MRRYHLKQGDRSSAGGVVLDGDETCKHYGTAMTYIGAKVDCQTCFTVGFIVGTGPRLPYSMMGQNAALDGDICACACQPSPVMIASQNDLFQELDVCALTHSPDGDNTRRLDAASTAPPARKHAQRVFVWDSITGEPLRNQQFIADIEGEQRSGRTDGDGYATLETDHSKAFRIHIVFSSPKRDLTPYQRA